MKSYPQITQITQIEKSNNGAESNSDSFFFLSE